MRSPREIQRAITAAILRFLPERFPFRYAVHGDDSSTNPIKVPETPDRVLRAVSVQLATGNEGIAPGSIPREARNWFKTEALELIRQGATPDDLRKFFRWDHCARLLFNDWFARKPRVLDRLIPELDNYEDRFFEAHVLMVATALDAETLDAAFQGMRLPSDPDLLTLLEVGLEGINVIRHAHAPNVPELSLVDLRQGVRDIHRTRNVPGIHLSRSAGRPGFPSSPGPTKKCA